MAQARKQQWRGTNRAVLRCTLQPQTYDEHHAENIAAGISQDILVEELRNLQQSDPSSRKSSQESQA